MGVCRFCKCSWMTPAEWFLRLVSIYYHWGFSDVLIYLLDMGVYTFCAFWETPTGELPRLVFLCAEGYFDIHTFMTCMYTCPYFASAVFLGDTYRMMQDLSPHVLTVTSIMVTVFSVRARAFCASLWLVIPVTNEPSSHHCWIIFSSVHAWKLTFSVSDNLSSVVTSWLCICMSVWLGHNYTEFSLCTSWLHEYDYSFRQQ